MSGVRGLPGEPGAPGLDGTPGPEGQRGRGHNAVFTLHSFSSTVPECPSGSTHLWAGYSLNSAPSLRRVRGGGGPASCSPQFALLETLGGLGRGSEFTWSAAEDMVEGEEEEKRGVADAGRLVGRCSVCEVERTLLTVHSGDTHTPDCPPGWQDMWTGFSYLHAYVSLHRPILSQGGSWGAHVSHLFWVCVHIYWFSGAQGAQL